MDNRSVPPGPPGPDGRRPRRRDRHGRGMRGPVAPPQVPLALTRSDTFDSLVLESADRLRRRLPELGRVDFGVREVPPVLPEGDDATVPLGGIVRARTPDGRDLVVVYRRPVELRSRDRDERAHLVHEVVVEQAAELLGLSPESVDPRYGQE
ncbi:metallopeptidase family protein [Streptomyces xiamenensis]|jgi:hypothetical protein|uniref:metallopeptidase family protein n=1 Tax=Streptomyces xiamenensis TaxID=408015 RepID=UPI0036EFB640